MKTNALAPGTLPYTIPKKKKNKYIHTGIRAREVPGAKFNLIHNHRRIGEAMKLQGNVNGAIYPITQQAYDEPIDATYRCSWCGHKFVAIGLGNHAYCSDRCRLQARSHQQKASYRRRHAR